MRRSLLATLCAVALAACTPPAPQPQPQPQPPQTTTLWDAPNDAFEAVEPTVFQVIGAPTVWDAVAPIGRAYEGGEGAPTLEVHIRSSGADQIADVVRTGLADDSIGAEHIRIEFRREIEGWFPTNAYVRRQCRRAPDPQHWSVAPCP